MVHMNWTPFDCSPGAPVKNCSFQFSAWNLIGYSLGVRKKKPAMSGVLSGS